MDDEKKFMLNRERAAIKIFVADEKSKDAFEHALRAMGLFSGQDEVVRGSLEKARDYLKENRSPEILVVDIDGEDLPISRMKELSDVVEPGTKVLVVGVSNDVGLFRELVYLGVNDYIVKPLTQDLCIQILKRLEDPTAVTEKKGRVVLLSGTRGGVGVSSFAQIAAHRVSQKHYRRAVVVDLDLYFGNIVMRKEGDNELMLSEILAQEEQLDELLILRSMKQVSDKVFMVGGVSDKISSNLPSPHAFLKLLAVLEQQFHYIFIDAPRYILPHFVSLMPRVKTPVLFFPPTVVGLRDTLRISRFYGSSWTYVANHAQPHGGLKGKEMVQHLGLSEEVFTVPYLKELTNFATFNDFNMLNQLKFPSEVDQLVNVISGLGAAEEPSFLKRLLGK